MSSAYGNGHFLNGNDASAYGKRSSALGKWRSTDGKEASALGNSSSALGKDPSAHGKEASALGNSSSALGKEPSAYGIVAAPPAFYEYDIPHGNSGSYFWRTKQIERMAVSHHKFSIE